MSSLVPTLDYSDLKDSDIIIEAVLENIKVKHQVVQEIEAVVRPDCVFASNTSALPIADIAKASKRPELVVGMHYFSPVDKMPLLEVITTDKTSKQATAAAVACGLKQGKVVITVKDSPAFYTTRILAFFTTEVFKILEEGQDPKKIDKLTKSMGFPVGAVTLQDEVGFDTAMHIGAYLSGVFGERLTENSNIKVGEEMVALGFIGRKGGKGFYIYDDGKKGSDRELNPKAMEILKRNVVPPKRSYTDTELKERMMTRFVNESILCLQEGVLANPVEGDIGAVFGLGFPPFLGGPFRYADTIGADTLVAQMEKFAADRGIAFAPCQMLLDYAKDPSKKFHTKSG
jgi:enoyl-CoA hydratase/long-chain 3-hydroxyacyl-CoA dehydrogenase